MGIPKICFKGQLFYEKHRSEWNKNIPQQVNVKSAINNIITVIKTDRNATFASIP